MDLASGDDLKSQLRRSWVFVREHLVDPDDTLVEASAVGGVVGATSGGQNTPLFGACLPNALKSHLPRGPILS